MPRGRCPVHRWRSLPWDIPTPSQHTPEIELRWCCARRAWRGVELECEYHTHPAVNVAVLQQRAHGRHSCTRPHGDEWHGHARRRLQTARRHPYIQRHLRLARGGLQLAQPRRAQAHSWTLVRRLHVFHIIRAQCTASEYCTADAERRCDGVEDDELKRRCSGNQERLVLRATAGAESVAPFTTTSSPPSAPSCVR